MKKVINAWICRRMSVILSHQSSQVVWMSSRARGFLFACRNLPGAHGTPPENAAWGGGFALLMRMNPRADVQADSCLCMCAFWKRAILATDVMWTHKTEVKSSVITCFRHWKLEIASSTEKESEELFYMQLWLSTWAQFGCLADT